MQIWRLEPVGLANPSTAHELMYMGPGFAHQVVAVPDFGHISDQTDLFLQSKARPVAGCP